MTTKEKILAAALKLYNEQGTDAITIRHIAKEINISHGNLQYHYKNTEEIILALFNQLAAAMDDAMAKAEAVTVPSFRQFLHDTEAFFDIAYHYRFIFLHFVAIIQKVPEIKTRYNNMDALREIQFNRIFKAYRNLGIFRNDIPEQVWKDLIPQIYIYADFWLAHNEIKTGLKGKKAIKHYVNISTSLFYPYLTPKGIASMESE
ncbi:transcriptional regulator, TetR family [Chitinophaga jiangningensis]|uniref:Transcriptional regulator, TetR family n=1 Tax=Chitinophaga jiangningensis TaxID=1419482 RepID=A0A1M7JUM2_9BACT|nr:TetR/AcrR family transcriptional regulator [Chitinophaga jiangningensis]SHM56625.1 transcriptional regulator, TetR family [Chitinophaga jiangningensis]